MTKSNETVKKLFPEEYNRVAKGKCPICGRPIDPSKFRDDLSRREFSISGFCQDCQDETFGEEE